MPLWTKKTPPVFAPHAEPTERGWEIPLEGTDPQDGLKELIVTIGEMPLKAGAGIVLSVAFGAESYEEGDPLSLIVRFSERVNVDAGASIVLSSTGSNDPITLYADEQLDVLEAVFDLEVDLETPVTVPEDEDETFTLSVEAQTLSGDIVDNDEDGEDVDKDISAQVASDAGERVVQLPAIIADVQFDEAEYVVNDPLSVTVTFNEAIDLTEGSIEIESTGTNIILHAAPAENVTEVVFNLEADLETPATVIEDDVTLSIEENAVSGDGVNTGTTIDINLNLSEALAQAAGSRVIPEE